MSTSKPRRRRPRRQPSVRSAVPDRTTSRSADRAGGREVIRASGPRDIVAAVPFQCGFLPAKSVVVISLRGPRHRFGMVSRLDLPPDSSGRPPDVSSAGEPWDHEQVADDIAAFVARDGGNGAVVAVYDDAPLGDGPPPARGVRHGTLDRLDRRGLPVVDALYVSPERYWSYICQAPALLPARGAVGGRGPELPGGDGLRHGRARHRWPVGTPWPSGSGRAHRSWSPPSRTASGAGSARRPRTSTESWTGPGPAPALPAVRREHLRRWTGEAFALMAGLVPTYRDGTGQVSVEQAGQLLASLHSRDIRDAVLMGFCRFGMAPPRDVSELLAIGFDPRAGRGRQPRTARRLDRPDGSDRELARRPTTPSSACSWICASGSTDRWPARR